jgi:hypothetical protein
VQKTIQKSGLRGIVSHSICAVGLENNSREVKRRKENPDFSYPRGGSRLGLRSGTRYTNPEGRNVFEFRDVRKMQETRCNLGRNALDTLVPRIRTVSCRLQGKVSKI